MHCLPRERQNAREEDFEFWLARTKPRLSRLYISQSWERKLAAVIEGVESTVKLSTYPVLDQPRLAEGPDKDASVEADCARFVFKQRQLKYRSSND